MTYVKPRMIPHLIPAGYNPDNRMQTQYGFIYYHEWLKKEKERIEKGYGRTAEIREYIVQRSKKITKSLWVNNVAEYCRWCGARYTEIEVKHGKNYKCAKCGKKG